MENIRFEIHLSFIGGFGQTPYLGTYHYLSPGVIGGFGAKHGEI